MRPITILLLILTVSLLIAACTPVVLVHPSEPGHETVIRDAGRQLGVKTRAVDEAQPGAVELEWRSAEDGVCGEALERLVGAESPRDALTEGVVECQPRAWSCVSPTYLAHELGHVLGLNHDDRDENLMAPAPKNGAEADTKQRLRVNAAAVGMSEVCK